MTLQPYFDPLTKACARHLDDRKLRIDFTGMSGHVPARQLPSQVNVSNETAEGLPVGIEPGNGSFSRVDGYHRKSSFHKAFFED
jgi:hypothetical protein